MVFDVLVLELDEFRLVLSISAEIYEPEIDGDECSKEKKELDDDERVVLDFDVLGVTDSVRLAVVEELLEYEEERDDGEED